MLGQMPAAVPKRLTAEYKSRSSNNCAQPCGKVPKGKIAKHCGFPLECQWLK